ncbi:Polyisoprenoid-binding protein YceI [Frankineae bacterium MT45]|nr:Polyisoprenoid-binding protein YceI [Frankineae bacterium MT45]
MTSAVNTPTITGDYTIDASHTRIGFVARHAMVTKVRGQFESFEGSLHLDLENPAASSAEISIDVASVNTASEQRDGHLRTNDFFDAPTFPKITFKSTSVEKVSDSEYKVTGDLTIKDVTKSVTVDWEFNGVATDPYGNQRAGFEGKTTLNRSDYGINFNAALDAGGVLVSEKITLEFDVSAIKTV